LITKKDRFKLFAYIKADLIRSMHLQYGLDKKVNSIGIWKNVFSPRYMPVLLMRISYYFYQSKLIIISKLFSMINFLLFGIEISISCKIGRGIYFPHSQGIVIGAVEVGENVTIYQGVTLGAKDLDFDYNLNNRPIIGNGVVIGSGAKVLGGIKIGDESKIGANAVVLKSVPIKSLAVGVPAKISE
jgi:serine O-acetyltransferase